MGVLNQPPLISIVVPCFNEAAVIRETHRRLSELALRLDDVRFEFIYVDDGSHDETATLLHELSVSDQRVRGLRLSRNFGHQVATTAGVENAAGDAVVIIDADLQDPPETIEAMVARWREGYQVAYGQRSERAGETRVKLWTARTFYRWMNRLSRVQHPVDTGDFRLMDRAVVEALLRMPERDRFLRGMVSWVGFRQVAVPYRRAARYAGESKYPVAKMLRFASDAVFSFSLAPLRLAVWSGFFVMFLALLGIGYAVVIRVFFDPTNWERGWASIFVAILFMGGVQLISLGIIGEYVGRIYGEVKQRPLYFVRERFGFRDDVKDRSAEATTASQ
ncbi:MAG: Glycosyltransferase [uncultured Chthoniobacterales bacterium]|uniref:Glycosyltransferase n=1 Tax=uncultured Chthoniobacterales bacterium TaxID=1836801 RepID=A0A6J4J236_9BACT|nr:MAG: Glycosyltransferase [uncultured Chthoniobacterales bacterium]